MDGWKNENILNALETPKANYSQIQVFKELADWADEVLELQCPSVCVCVCVSICAIGCSFCSSLFGP